MVTGGALGIGGGISRRLAAAGAHVVLADINADAASASHDDITAAGGRCTVVVGDIRDRDVVAEVTETALAVEDSRIDILVNNVGDFRPAARDFLHSTEDQWQTLYELNLLHVLRMCHAVLPAMVDRWARGDREQRDSRGVPRHSLCRPVCGLQRGRGGVHPQPGRRRGPSRDPCQRDRPRPRRHGADARRAHAARPRPRPDQDLDPGGPVRQARRLRGASWNSWHPTTRGSSPGRRSRWTAARWPLPGGMPVPTARAGRICPTSHENTDERLRDQLSPV